MAQYRLVTLVIAAISIALGAGPSQARDSSACQSDDPRSAKANAPATQCLEALEPSGPLPGDSKTVPYLAGQIARTESFVYRVRRPETPSGETIILLHGSGGDESSMFKLASRIAPHATLLGVRGRIVQKGIKRWYARVSPTEFDQQDIRGEAEAFVGFLHDIVAAEELDLDRATFIGYSNGANLIGALTLLHPNLIHRAVLLRAMPVLQAAPAPDLSRSRFLTVAGKMDKVYSPFAPALEALLRARGATVDSRIVARGHLLGDEDVKVVSEWLSASSTIAGETAQ